MVSRPYHSEELKIWRATLACAAYFVCTTFLSASSFAKDEVATAPSRGAASQDPPSKSASQESKADDAVKGTDAPPEGAQEGESVLASESEEDAAGDSARSEATQESEADAQSGAEEPTDSPARKETDYTMVDTSVVTRVTTPGEAERRNLDNPSTRWSEVGGFVGMVSRASSSSRFKYRPGVAYGGYFRPQLNKYLGVRIFYREERINVDAKPGAYDYGDETHDLDLEQPKLKVTSLGVRIEPSYPVTDFLHVVGVVSWSWARMVAQMPEAEDFHQRADRAAVELNWGLGAGIELDLLKNWLSLSCVGAYHFVSNQTGTAYDPIQAIVDGQMTQFAPIAPPKNMVDVLFSIGLIL